MCVSVPVPAQSPVAKQKMERLRAQLGEFLEGYDRNQRWPAHQAEQYVSRLDALQTAMLTQIDHLG